MLLGIAGAVGGAGTCVGVLTCAMGAPAVAFSLSNVGEGATGIANTINDTNDGKGTNFMVDQIKDKFIKHWSNKSRNPDFYSKL